MQMHCLSCLRSVWQQSFGRDILFKYVFTAEKVEWRRNFIINQWSPEQCFGDVIELCENGWEGKDYISGETRYLAKCDICFAGFACGDSELNNSDLQSSENGMEENSGRTGSTARATLDLITRCRCRAFLENLEVLGQQNMHYLTKCLNDNRMIVVIRRCRRQTIVRGLGESGNGVLWHQLNTLINLPRTMSALHGSAVS